MNISLFNLFASGLDALEARSATAPNVLAVPPSMSRIGFSRRLQKMLDRYGVNRNHAESMVEQLEEIFRFGRKASRDMLMTIQLNTDGDALSLDIEFAVPRDSKQLHPMYGKARTQMLLTLAPYWDLLYLTSADATVLHLEKKLVT